MTDNPVVAISRPKGRAKHQPKNWVCVRIPLFTGYLVVVGNDKGLRKAEKEFCDTMDHPCAFHKDSDALASIAVLRDARGVQAYVVSVDLEGVATAGDMIHTQLAGVLAHEASHLTDMVLENVGEDHPGTETRAYLTQWAVEVISEFYYARFDLLRQSLEAHEH